jgi:hypothetical protein
MTDATRTALDLGAEAAIAPWEYALVAIAAAAALAYLARGVLIKRRRLAAGDGCGGCPGCGAAGVCESRQPFARPEDDART